MEAKETIDARGLLCPLPVLKLRKRLKSLAAGDCALLLADDPAAVVDVPHFCAEAGHALLSQSDDRLRTRFAHAGQQDELLDGRDLGAFDIFDISFTR